MTSPAVYKEFGMLIRARRQTLGLTQEQLAEKVGLSRTSITNIEQGRQKILLHQLFLLAESLQVNPDVLLPTTRAADPERRIDDRLLEHLSDREKDWVRRIVVSPAKKGGTSHGGA
jgi:transcriptional regulator with XRE-family HTH domain